MNTANENNVLQGREGIACVDFKIGGELLRLAVAVNRVAKCFSEDLRDREECLEGLRKASEILGQELGDPQRILQDLEGLSRSRYLYEGSHVSVDPVILKAQLSSLYRSFGLAERGEMPDHISVELEFLSFLLAKIFASSIKDDESGCRESLKAARIMVKDHLSSWLPSIKRRISPSETVEVIEIVESLIHRVKDILG